MADDLESKTRVTVQPDEIIERAVAPEGTDVLAVQWRDDPAPVALGEIVVR